MSSQNILCTEFECNNTREYRYYCRDRVEERERERARAREREKREREREREHKLRDYYNAIKVIMTYTRCM